MPAPVDDGVKAFVTKLVGWTDEGKHAQGRLGLRRRHHLPRGRRRLHQRASCCSTTPAAGRCANLSTKIGDAFDWVATGCPCGTAACSGMPGGAGLVAIKYTQNPEEVAKVMDCIARKDILKEFTERTLFLPAHKGIIEAGGLKFDTDDPHVQAALDTFVAAAPTIAPPRRRCRRGSWAVGLLRRARHPHQPGDGRRAAARGGLRAHRQDIADQVSQAQAERAVAAPWSSGSAPRLAAPAVLAGCRCSTRRCARCSARPARAG